jgi:ABC-type branched-subunit amino acid transport system substrate-binding protein
MGLVIAACGDDDDSSADTTPAEEAATAVENAETSVAEAEAAAESTVAEEAAAAESTVAEAMTEETTAESGSAAGGEELATEGDVEVAAGTVLTLDDCPSDWDPVQGADGDEIRLGMTLPQSGQLAAFGNIGSGMQAYFDYLNENDPIADKDITLVLKDDGYEAGRAVANVEEMLDTEDIFAFTNFIGTPINVATRPITDEACVPQLFNSSGFPIWGDPANYPWTIGGLLSYVTEANIWCQAIVDEFGEGATVAALYMNNDFGTTYQNTLNQCEGIDIVEEQLHDPAAPDVTNEMTTLISSDADVFVAGTTAAFCPQTVASVAASEWRPRYYMSYTCNQLASFFEPVKDAAAALSADGAGVRMTNSNKVCGDPKYDDDPVIVQAREILDQYGGYTCEEGSYFVGIIYAQGVEDVLRPAAEMAGGLNRVNLMSSVWNEDTTSDWLLDGTYKTDGVNDAFIVESAQIQEVAVDGGNLTFEPIGDVIDLEGQGGSYQGG